MISKINTRLFFTYRDMVYEKHGKGPRKKNYKYKELFDLSNYPKSSKYFCSDNKILVGKMKD